MAAGKLTDPNVGEFLQMAVFSLILAGVMLVFGLKEDGTSTRILCFVTTGVFLLATGFFGATTASLVMPRRKK